MSQQAPSELLYLADEDFRHPITGRAGRTCRPGHAVRPAPGGAALDYIRGNLFDRDEMRALPADRPGPDNDLADRWTTTSSARSPTRRPDLRLRGALGTGDRQAGQDLRIPPGNGVHDIHMNQGNAGRFAATTASGRTAGCCCTSRTRTSGWRVFLAFQSQAWHTDDVTGHALAGDPGGRTRHPCGSSAALVNPVGPAPEAETVTLLNAGPQDAGPHWLGR